MSLIFEETFSDSSVFLNRWGFEVGHIRNQEQQYYVSGLGNNVFLTENGLKIEGRKETVANAFYQAGSSDWRYMYPTASYTSGSIYTKDYFTNFEVEIKATTPSGQGVWPALWLFESSGGLYREIDIMEVLGQNPEKHYVTFHYGNNYPNIYSVNCSRIITPNTEKTYRAVVDENQISVYLDGLRLHQIWRYAKAPDGSSLPLRRNYRLKINLALGGTWPGNVDDNALPCSFFVKYVKMWQL